MKLHFNNMAFVSILLLLNTYLSAQNIGIGIVNPTRPLSFPALLGKKISLYPGATGDAGFGVFGNELRIHSDYSGADITFGYDTYESTFTEIMRIKGNGNVGIGVTNPADAGLVVNKKIGAVNAMFGRNTTGVAIESNFPGIGFNCYYNAGRKTIAAGYASLINSDPVSGNLGLYNSNVSTPADATATLLPRLIIDKDGDIGVEGNTAPHAPLSFANLVGSKISLFGSVETSNYGFGVQSSLMQMYTASSTTDIAFGYGGSTSFTERMRIKGNGNVGIGTSAPGFILDVNGRMRLRHNGSSSGLWLANSTNTNDVGFVGLMNDTHVGVYGDNGAGWNLVMNTTTGNVGIGTTSPYYPFEVVGSALYAGKFDNTSAEQDPTGIVGRALASPTGVGVLGVGRQVGVYGEANFSGSGNRFGVSGYAANGTLYNWGLYGYGLGGSIAYGIYAEASGGTTNWAGYFQGNVYCTGSYLPSDRKLKNGILPLNNALAVINQLKPTVYTYRTNEYKQLQLPEGSQYGLIADEVLQVIPNAVTKAKQPAQYENRDEQNGRKLSDEVEFNAVNYTQMIPILIGAIQEQQAIINKQDEKIKELESRLTLLERKLN